MKHKRSTRWRIDNCKRRALVRLQRARQEVPPVRQWPLLLRIYTWRFCWLQPLLALHRAGMLDRDQFETAAMGPLRGRE